ncbi:RrF2 family transcriptional regulator [Oligoflexus tunisiensis]|uniref:RrF2 family transcriptional regulator n=1 Tax=Oligoflexus tunisiensis TaxID=708132 RepID=UPI00159F1B90|nr:Rrf2 family transcriptional regulator [Oligoflexus tunisiensis]
MNLTSRSRYALKIMLDLAYRHNEPLVRRQEIVARQGIPSKYLDQILVRLRRDGLVESVRGRTGGYRIGRDTNLINVWEIFRAVEDGIYPVECVDEHAGCEFHSACIAKEPWQLIFENVRRSLSQMTLADIAEKFQQDEKNCAGTGVRECRPGREPLRAFESSASP